MFRVSISSHKVLLFLMVITMGFSSISAIYRPYPLGNTDNISGLIYCINQANSTAEDDVVELGGVQYVFNSDCSADAGCTAGNALPDILSAASAGKLSVINGTIKRSRVAGTPSFRFFNTLNGANLEFYNTTLDFGQVSNANGGAIYNAGNLSFNNSFLSNNSSLYTAPTAPNCATNCCAGGCGGGIYNIGTIDKIGTTKLSYNTASFFGGAIYNDNLIIEESIFTGIISIINNAVFSNNFAAGVNFSNFTSAIYGQGGAIYNNSVINSIINTSMVFNFGCNGGAIINAAAISLISNSTFYSNVGNTGGAISNIGTISTIENSTITKNGNCNTNKTHGGGIYNSGTINLLTSSIVANNFGGTDGPDIISSMSGITSENNNLLSSTSGNSIQDGVNNDIVTVDTGLGVLHNNGGFTPTVELYPSSIALNNGYTLVNMLNDQRGHGYLRTKCGRPDIGAFELQTCF